MADEPERIESKVEATSSAVTTDPKESSEEEVNTNPICKAAEMDATPSTNENKETTTDEDVKDEPNEIQGNNQRATTLATAATKATEIVTAHPSTKLSPHSTNIPNQSELTDKNDTLHTISFNQDGGCLAVGTESGFRICNVYPFHEMNRRRLDGDGIAQIEMLYRTNLIALTGANTLSPTPSQYQPNKVIIYDNHEQRAVGILTMRKKVIRTKLRRDCIIVVLRDRIYIYNFSDLTVLDKIHTIDNPRGLVGISVDNGGVGGSTVVRADDALGVNRGERNGLVLACPSMQRGQVRVELYGLRRTTFVNAHESDLGALALSVDGSLLATASERGTVIRLFDTRGVTVGDGRVTNGTGADTSTQYLSSSLPLREFRRGVERATITCLTFSIDSCWLAAASDHGTVHIFQAQDLNTSNKSSSKSNPQKHKYSKTGKAIRMLPKIVVSPTKFLIDGESSVAQVRGVPYPRACAFVPDRDCTIAVAGEDEYGNGCLLLSEFGKPITHNTSNGSENRDESEAKRLSYHRFFKKDSAAAMHGKSNRRRFKNKDSKRPSDLVEGGAFIDDCKVDLKMDHIHIGLENEDNFVPIDLETNK